MRMPGLSTALVGSCHRNKVSPVEDCCYPPKTTLIRHFLSIVIFLAICVHSTKRKNPKYPHHDAALSDNREIKLPPLKSLGNFEPPKFFYKVHL